MIVISDETRSEFDYAGRDYVRESVRRGNYSEPKLSQARAWLDENDPAWISARAAQAAGFRANIALVLSGLAILVAIAGLFK